ncbi:phosphoribosyltransferase-like protein [Sphingobacterium athyrii]|nr:hypothetical protein [Sphingobacterium athyrii]
MINVAQNITNILSDYENNHFTSEHVLDWVSQFNAPDQGFVLEELQNIFQKTYYSKAKCAQILKLYIEQWIKVFKYPDVPTFIAETVFLKLQPDHKSQCELLNLLDEILVKFYNCNLGSSGLVAKQYIYLDDVLSTGQTIGRNFNEWFNLSNEFDKTKTNFHYLKDKQIKIHVCLLCGHSWGIYNTKYGLIKNIGIEVEAILHIQAYYIIENNIKQYNPKLNNMIPVDNQDPVIHEYLNSLKAVSKSEHAFRLSTQPHEENLFSSTVARNRLEILFLTKGIEILSRVGELRVEQIRPLGYTVKSHKTFGLGTLFFTYRNIPNNSPIVFWWGNNNWRPLFVLKNRGVR